MIINPTAPSGDVIFCDDVRQEINGKLTLVGVYANSLIIGSPAPVTLPQLCAVIRLKIAPPATEIEYVVHIYRTDEEKPIFEVKAKITPTEIQFPSGPMPHLEPDSVAFMVWQITAQLAGINIDQDIAFKVRAFVGEDEIRLGSLQVSFSNDIGIIDGKPQP